MNVGMNGWVFELDKWANEWTDKSFVSQQQGSHPSIRECKENSRQVRWSVVRESSISSKLWQIKQSLTDTWCDRQTDRKADSSYRRDSAQCGWNRHSRSLEVIRCCANWRDFLLAPSSNLTSIFNRSWDITPSLHIRTSPLFQMELEKDGWECSGRALFRGAQNVGLSNHKLKSSLTYIMWSQCTSSKTDRQTSWQ